MGCKFQFSPLPNGECFRGFGGIFMRKALLLDTNLEITGRFCSYIIYQKCKKPAKFSVATQKNKNRLSMQNDIQHLTKLKTSQRQIQKLFSFDPKIFKQICTCGKIVGAEIHQHIKTQEIKTIIRQSFMCKTRFCPLCNYYRVRNLSPQIVSVFRDLKSQGKELLFLTFTVPNCGFGELRSTIQKMNKSFNKMSKSVHFKSIIHWIRTLEITFKEDQAHPHFHCIFAVDCDYFKHENYMRTSDWSKLWSRCYKSKTGLVVDARSIKPKKNGSDAVISAVAELSKYVIKSADLKKLTTENMEQIYNELKNLRFIATSQNVKLEEDKEQNLDSELWQLIEIIVYCWDNSTRNYQQKRIESFKN